MISHGDASDVCLPSMIAVNYNTGRLFVCQLRAERVQSNDPPWEVDSAKLQGAASSRSAA